VKVRKINGEVHLIPIQEKVNANDCPLLGLYADGKLTVEKHLAWSREDKALEAIYKISLADSFAVAQAKVTNGILLTSDHHELEAVEASEPIKFLWIR